MHRSRVLRRLTALLAMVAVVFVGLGSLPAHAAVAPVANPSIEEKCGVDLTLVLDASGSVEQAGAVNQVRDAAKAFLDALSNTGSTARVTQFASVAGELAAQTLVDDASLGPGGVLRDAIDGYYNPRPPRPTNVNFINRSGGISNSSSNNQYTNWDGSLHQAAETTPNLVVYVTDGDPTAYDLDRPGDPGDPGPPPDIRIGTDSNDAATLDRAVEEANRVKTQGSRMLAVGVGNALSKPASQQRLTQISGGQIVRDADLTTIDSLNDVDVALVTEFEDLAAFLRSVVLQLCSPSLTIQKLAESPDSAAYNPTAGWNMTVTPRVPSGTGFTWILPDSAAAPAKTVTTDGNGFAQFQWEPIPSEAESAAGVSESLQPGYTAGRPGPNNDFSCDFKDEDGAVRTVTGELTIAGSVASFDLDPIGQEVGTCKVYNSFDYQPAINVEKVNNPTSLRGDLTPPATVTSSYAVTNPGNTPLSNVRVDDNVCGQADPVPAIGDNVGDTNRDGRLQPGETWQFTCTHSVSTPASTNPAGQTIPNTATATGIPPTGPPVTDTADATVTAFNPRIHVDKLVNGQESVNIQTGSPVTYTYRVTNTGNTNLSPVTLSDDTPPCSTAANLVRGPDAPGNNDAVLALDEAWTYSCAVSGVSADVTNLATVTGTPLNPTTNQPFPAPNPTVTDTDRAAVTVVNPGIQLTKTAAPTLVLLPHDGGAQSVTYTFTATNPGQEPLNRPGAATGGPSTKDPGWVSDAVCTAPPTYVTGDTNVNNLLDPGEEWRFTCTGMISAPTVNIAAIVGQPSLANGDPIPGVGVVSDKAIAFVDVVRPGIAVTKTALRGVVLDPDAAAVSGPDVPTRRPAQYAYDIRNTGDVPLQLVPAPPVDNMCGPLVPDPNGLGDTNGDGRLDPDEVWHYTCTTTLQRQQGNTPPVTGKESGLVTNTVHVAGVPFFQGQLVPGRAVSDNDTAQVLVTEPGIAITKTASPTGVRPGHEVTYTFVVTNTGDVGLTDVLPVDDKCSPLTRTGGDNGNDILDGANSGAAESWTYTCVRAVGIPPNGETADVNTVSVSGVDPLGNTYEATASAQVKIVNPAIHLEKTVSNALVPAGTTVTYGFTVTNTGGSPIPADDVLDSVSLGDTSNPSNPACARPVLVAKEGGNQDDQLDREPAETWRYACEGTITETTVDLAAVGALGGSTIDTRVPVFDFATAQVTVFHPAITIEKSASPTTFVGGGDVTYTYLVRNTGDVPLADVTDRLSDDTCSPVEYVSGDTDDDGLLDTPTSILEDALDETWVFTCTAHVDKDTVNTVVVSGTPTDSGGTPLCNPACDPSANAAATVTVTPVSPPQPPSPEPVLPGTGVADWTILLVGIGIALLVVGTGLTWWATRRRRSRQGASGSPS